MKRAAILAALLLAVTGSLHAANRARYLMGTVCAIEAADTAEIEAAFGEAARIEALLSTWLPGSELSRLNRAGQGEISPELIALLEVADNWRERTGGAFNPGVGPLLEAWRIREEGRVPSVQAIHAALEITARRICIHGGTVDLRGARLEEGAFGKGYALDQMLTKLTGARATIDFGGQITQRGSRDVTVADPEARQSPVVGFTLQDGSLSTTSGSEKSFTSADRRFTHIIDPRTGEALPPRGSVSVVRDDALSADILSTALYVMGVGEGLAFAEANGIAALYLTPDHQVRTSVAFRKRIGELRLLSTKYERRD